MKGLKVRFLLSLLVALVNFCVYFSSNPDQFWQTFWPAKVGYVTFNLWLEAIEKDQAERNIIHLEERAKPTEFRDIAAHRSGLSEGEQSVAVLFELLLWSEDLF